MHDLITGATTFSKYLRYQICTKQNQTLHRDVYSHKIHGSQIKGGLEACDFILLEHQNISFVDAEDILTRYKNIITQYKDTLKDANIDKTFYEYTKFKITSTYGKRNKAIIRAVDFEKEIKLAVLRGGLKTCEKLVGDYYRKPIEDIDLLMGDVHLLRMSLWNTYALSSRKIRKVDVLDTMLVNPSRSKLIFK